jgi:hypothetical protein
MTEKVSGKGEIEGTRRRDRTGDASRQRARDPRRLEGKSKGFCERASGLSR